MKIAKCLFYLVGLIAVVSTWAADVSIKEITSYKDPGWPVPPTRVDLKPYGEGCTPLEFSADSRYLCAWWPPSPPIGDYDKLPGRAVVFDLAGNRISDGTDEQGKLSDKFASMFPATSWRWRFSNFLKDTGDFKVTCWGFTPDMSFGVRLLKSTGYGPTTSIDAELWSFGSASAKLWTVTIPAGGGGGKVGFFTADHKDYVLVALQGIQGYVYSRSNGALVNTFTYGKPESKADALARKEKFSLSGDASDPSLMFSASTFAIDPERRLLACGDFFSRRLRVVSVERPYKVVFEANTQDNPEQPPGGVWRVNSLFFGGSGEYLIVGYAFGGPGADKTYDPIEIYDTHHWQIVWSINAPEVCSVNPPRISPDGTIIAYTRDDLLEIGRFAPKKIK